MDPNYEDYLSELVDDSEDEDLGVDEEWVGREDFGFFGDEALCGE